MFPAALTELLVVLIYNLNSDRTWLLFSTSDRTFSSTPTSRWCPATGSFSREGGPCSWNWAGTIVVWNRAGFSVSRKLTLRFEISYCDFIGWFVSRGTVLSQCSDISCHIVIGYYWFKQMKKLRCTRGTLERKAAETTTILSTKEITKVNSY